jgi:hypothetical protein
MATAAFPLTAAIPAVTTAVAAATASRFRARFVHIHSAAAQLGAVQLGDSGLRRLRIRHFDEGESTGLPGGAVRYYTDAVYRAISLKSGLQVFLRCLIAEISDKDVGHSLLSPFQYN